MTIPEPSESIPSSTMPRRTFTAIALLLVAGVVAAGCDPSDVDRLPRAVVGRKCTRDGAFARNTSQVLQCSKGKWRVSTSIAAAKALIVANTATTAPPATSPPTTAAPRFSAAGNIEAAQASGATIAVSGWVVSRSTATITVDGVPVPSVLNVPTVPGSYPNSSLWGFTPNVARPDITAAVSGAGATAGFTVVIDTTMRADVEVCLGTMNSSVYTKPSSVTVLSCRRVSVAQPRSFPPAFAYGHIESAVISNGTIVVSGWALRTGRGDEDGLPRISLTVNGSAAAAADTNVDRPDVGALFPGTGIRHGFTAVIGLSSIVCPCRVGFDTTTTTGWLDEWSGSSPPGTIGTRLTLPLDTVLAT